MSSEKRRVLFLTGTRADFGKMKSLIRAVDMDESFNATVVVTGMHTLKLYGFTADEVFAEDYSNVFVIMNQIINEPMEMVLANTVIALSRYVREINPDLIVVHGDRVEAMAGAIVGAFTNTRVAHIEGGELSGTVDEIVRHSVSKLSHVHFVANETAAQRLMQMGETPGSVFIVGSPDIDLMVSDSLASLEQAKAKYEIPWEEYGVAIFHPITTEFDMMPEIADSFVTALLECGRNFVVVYPNNDHGCETILTAYRRLAGNPRFRVIPSLRFEYFLTVLKNARFMIGNSSAGVREAPFYGLPSVNIGTRQNNRCFYESIINCDYATDSILTATETAAMMPHSAPSNLFGTGESTKKFMEILKTDKIWDLAVQKQFSDIPMGTP